MKDKWAKNVCPFCKDQGFDSIIGDPLPGETVISFTHTMTSDHDTLDFATVTAKQLGVVGPRNQRIIHQMRDIMYRVFATRADEGDESHTEAGATYQYTKDYTGFVFYGESGYTYDFVVIGRVNF